ncbi:AraC-like DNA-binding protein [Nonomuraea thailandensis]|uniref:AraC-like DNA-binding protein n=1 Tax=Nonomuraea thailandensis TaxID=1188745 RepID=A0A9X2GMS3_9ACTN|nr:helix-turn-helix domain-containing protein [Nonomuraea thailandensis]MCP2357163.1 AraC-like DNA-binding protein [Nonomuraea thailandensis]
MLLLDTADVRPQDRIEVFEAAALGQTGSCGVEHELGPDGLMSKRLEGWRFGPVAMYFNSGTGMRYWQTSRHLRMDSWNTVSVLAQVAGPGRFIWNDHQQVLTARDLVVASKSAGYWERTWSGVGSNIALMIDAEQIALPDSMIHNAVPRITLSPITPLVLNHIHALRRDADRLETDAGGDDVGQATLSLVRALIASVITDDRARRAIGNETLLVRVLAYIRAHLTDPELTPARIAAAHNISLRSLYRLCEDGGLSLEQWIIRRRLDGARSDLTAPEHAHRTIDAIARSWGFTHPGYFTRRFRGAYGLTPREARRQGKNHAAL